MEIEFSNELINKDENHAENTEKKKDNTNILIGVRIQLFRKITFYMSNPHSHRSLILLSEKKKPVTHVVLMNTLKMYTC